MKQRMLLIVVCFCAVFLTHSEVVENDSMFFTDIDSFIEKGLREWDVPGVCIAIVKDGKVVMTKAYGVADVKTKKPVTLKTLFSIASVTKSFTAATAMVSAQQKKIDIDIPLRQYFPDLQFYDEYATHNSTMRDLLVHRSGIPREKFFSINPPTTRLQVRECLRYFEPTAGFREVFQYCNETYTVAGDMLGELHATTWEALVNDFFLQPLHMNTTYFSFSKVPKNEHIATPYIRRNGSNEQLAYHNADILGPAGCMVSTIGDMTQWMLLHLQRGKFENAQIVEPQFLYKMHWPQIVMTDPMMFPEISHKSYAMGSIVDYYRGHKRITFAGNLYGFSATVAFLPNDNAGVVILANINDSYLHQVLSHSIFDRLLGSEPIDWNARYQQIHKRTEEYYQKMAEKNPPPPTEALELHQKSYLGLYQSQGYGSIQCIVRKKHLIAVIGGVECSMRYIGKGYFEVYHPIEDFNLYFHFTVNDGNVASLELQVVPHTKEIVFTKQ